MAYKFNPFTGTFDLETPDTDTTYSAGALLDLSTTTFNVDLTEANEAAIADGDYILFLDGGATGSHAKEAVHDLATLFSGTGLTATNSAIAVDSSQAITALTGGDLTIYEDANNADVSLKIGTSAAESLSIEVLNGTSNKTADEIKISTATDSGTVNHGKISIHIDGVEILDIDDGGIDMASGKTVAINGTDLPTQLSGLSDWSSSNNAPSALTYESLMPNIGDFHHDEDTGFLYTRYTPTKLRRFQVTTIDYTPVEPDPPTALTCKFWSASSGGSQISSSLLVGTTDSAYAKVTYNSEVDNAISGTPQARFDNNWKAGEAATAKDLDTSSNTRTSSAFTIGESGNAGSDENQRDNYSRVYFNHNNATEEGQTLSGSPSHNVYWRNNKRYGKRDNDPTSGGLETWANALNNANGGLNNSNDYSNIGTVTFEIGDGDQVFFAIPEGTTDITSIKLQGNSTELISSFSTTTATYTNSASYQDTYKIWYTPDQQAPGTSTWVVS